MSSIVGPALVAGSKNLYFKLSATQRNEKYNITTDFEGNFVIDIDGTIYQLTEPQPDTAAITIVGGIDTFIGEKQPRPSVFYLTQNQKVTLYKICKEVARLTDKAQLHSDNTILDHLITNTYSNYVG